MRVLRLNTMLKYSIVLFAAFAVANSNNIYYGYDRASPNTAVEIPADVLITDPGIPIVPAWPTIVLVHGHTDDLNAESNQLIRREIMQHVIGTNVIIVDWSIFSKLSYSNAAGAVPIVGRQLAEFLVRLAIQTRINYANLHLVGFNLGAHVVGHAGREVLRLTGVQVARITGLDPSSSQWGSGSPRLRNSDAAYVEVIHTDGSGLGSNGLGTAIGDVDFFVNGGSNQPGCVTHACSHRRAYEIFAGTLARSQRLYGNLCASSLQLSLNSCSGQQLYVGDTTLDKIRVDGTYRVNTGRTYPF